MEENKQINMNGTQKKKKSGWLILTIILSIVVILVLATLVLTLIIKDMINYEQQKGMVKPKQMVSEYLYEKYQKNFNVEFSSEGYKSKILTLDGSSGECGHDRNIKEYVFKVSLDNSPIISYITYWENIETGEIEIKEVNGEKSNSIDTSHKRLSKLYSEKSEIKSKLDDLLKITYSNFQYTINYEYDYDKIEIVFHHEIFKNIEEDLKFIEKLIPLLQGKETNIKVKFSNDFEREYSSDSKIEEEKEYFYLVKDFAKTVKENYSGMYTIEQDSAYIVVEIPVNIEQVYYTSKKSVYEKLYSALLEFTNNNSCHIKMKFNDKTISLSHSSKEKETLEEQI